MGKVCYECGIEKEFDQFGKDSRKKDGLNIRCKECTNARARDRSKNPEAKRKIKEYRDANKDRASEYSKEYRKNNAEKLKAYRQTEEYKNKRKENRKTPEYREWRRQYRQSDKYREQKNAYQRSEAYKKWRNEYRKDSRKLERNKILKRLRARVQYILNDKYDFPETFSCSKKEFRDYVESMFHDDMSWDNYGSYWQIDHYVPCSYFYLVDGIQQKICFHYSNLRPLKSRDNLLKNNKLPEDYKEKIEQIKEALSV